MTRFNRRQLIAFIHAVDRNLEAPVAIVIVGGAAACVGYDSAIKTADIDVFQLLTGSAAVLMSAVEVARKETGLAVSVGAAAVAELPENYESRLRPVRGLKLRKLKVVVPEKYDIALSKTLRGYPHDIDAIEGIHVRHRLAAKTLIHRFETELMTIAIADVRKIKLNMAMVAARLYGFDAGRRLAEKWKVPVPRPK